MAVNIDMDQNKCWTITVVFSNFRYKTNSASDIYATPLKHPSASI